MKPRLKLEGDTLEITFSGVQDKDRGRLCNIELALLRAYTKHNSYPVVHKDDGMLFQWVRGDSDWATYHKAQKVLREFQFEV